jgi:HAD superfamily hydrolase (TIGR01509 family)
MRAPRFAAVFFDLDGTLADSARDITLALEFAFADVGIHTEHPVHRLVDGSPLEAIFALASPESTSAEFDRFALAYRARYEALGHQSTRLYPGARETLEALSLLRPPPWLAVATAKRSVTARAVCQHLGIEQHFRAIEGTAGTALAPKPSPDLLNLLLRRAEVPADRCLLVGDTLRDVLAGKAAGVRTAAATWGHGRREELIRARPDHVLEDLEDLLPLLNDA